MFEQQLHIEFQNVPVGASQAHCSTISSLNSLEGKRQCGGDVLVCNSLDVNQVQQTGRSIKAYVFVLSKDGFPLMPCSFAKSKRMVKRGLAKVVRIYPFVIRLNFECNNQVQDVTLGIDSGYKHVGISAVSEKQELFSGTLVLDDKTKGRLDDCRIYRRGRRNKLWYRKPRFDNRRRKEGWLPPSIERRYNAHLRLIDFAKKLLPVTKTVIEVGNFDIQRINNPDIHGIDYQRGDRYGYENIRAYLMSRERGVCQLCGKDFKGKPSHVHHIIPRDRGGTDKSDNLSLLHKDCHDRLHKRGLYKELKKNRQYKDSTFMNIVRSKFWGDVDDLQATYGYFTFLNRNEINLEKSHINDAFVIAGGKNQERVKSFELLHKRRNNRCLQKNRNGYVPSIRRQRYSIRPKDLIWVGSRMMQCNGIFNKGKSVLVGKKSYSVKSINRVYHFGGMALNIAV